MNPPAVCLTGHMRGRSWWYDWSLNPAAAAGGHGGFRQEFVAMAWGRGMAAELPGWTP